MYDGRGEEASCWLGRRVMPRGKPSQLLRDKLAPKKTKNKKRSNPYSKSPFLEEKNGGKKMLRRTDPEKNGNRLAQELEPSRGRPKPKYLDLGMHRWWRVRSILKAKAVARASFATHGSKKALLLLIDLTSNWWFPIYNRIKDENPATHFLRKGCWLLLSRE